MLVHKIYNLLAETVGGKQLGSVIVTVLTYVRLPSLHPEATNLERAQFSTAAIMLKRSVLNSHIELLPAAS
jgi:hypothetical protein